MNKNVSVWRGVLTPPTHSHIWIKDESSIYIYRNGWEPLVKEATEEYSGFMSKTDKLILELLNKNLTWK